MSGEQNLINDGLGLAGAILLDTDGKRKLNCTGSSNCCAPLTQVTKLKSCFPDETPCQVHDDVAPLIIYMDYVSELFYIGQTFPVLGFHYVSGAPLFDETCYEIIEFLAELPGGAEFTDTELMGGGGPTCAQCCYPGCPDCSTGCNNNYVVTGTLEATDFSGSPWTFAFTVHHNKLVPGLPQCNWRHDTDVNFASLTLVRLDSGFSYCLPQGDCNLALSFVPSNAGSNLACNNSAWSWGMIADILDGNQLTIVQLSMRVPDNVGIYCPPNNSAPWSLTRFRVIRSSGTVIDTDPPLSSDVIITSFNVFGSF